MLERILREEFLMRPFHPIMLDNLRGRLKKLKLEKGHGFDVSSDSDGEKVGTERKR